jgi:hypothetical protein
MPFNSEQLAYAGRAALDFYLRNDPIDEINTARPLIKKLMEGKKNWSGGLQYVQEQLRYQNDSNFQPYFGDSQVTYNRKRTLQVAKYTWGSFHDGFGLNEDELTQQGVVLTDDRGATPTENEKIQLTNLLGENLETLKLGFQEGFDKMIHRDGSQDPLEIAGLDALVSLAPSSGTIGGLAASNAYWQNYANTAVNSTSSFMLDDMETAWRACIRFGGFAPDYILAGSDFIDAYRNATVGGPGSSIQRTLPVSASGGNKGAVTVDGSVGSGVSTGVYFKGVEIIWDPVFDVLDTEDNPTISWASRCYFLNTKFITLRPIEGHWMIARRPPRVYDRYVHYWALTAKAAFTTGKRNAHAVLALA